ncbi:hypothetical protein FOA52_012302 [Chlamydomonas sp. UWO 241]|nr:hypothetical protein FOA52_012302 [Chlamydomonas sp. UWO 241]
MLITLHVSAGKTPNTFHVQQLVTAKDVVLFDEPPSLLLRLQAYPAYAGRWVRGMLATTFLPAGYPSSTGANYISYCTWSGVTNFAVTANSVLASTFLLYSVGLGAGSIAAAGALNWVLKDGLGQLGTLIFGKVIAHNFDIHSKSWYFLSNVMLMLATAIEMCTIVVPQHFLIMASVANCIKGLAWMANGSTRSVFNLSFAKDNNIADITAKSTSQWIFASLFGTAIGASMCTTVGQNVPVAMACYSLLAGITIYSAYKTCKNVPLPTLNNTRLQLLAQLFLGRVREAAAAKSRSQRRQGYTSWDKDGGGGDDAIDDSQIEYDRSFDEELAHKIPSPVMLASDEPLALIAKALNDDRLMNPRIFVGGSLYETVAGDPELLIVLLATFKYSHYMVLPSTGFIHVVLHEAADQRDICQAYLHACILRTRTRQGVRLHAGEMAELRIALQDSLLAAERLTTPFMNALSECGWRTEKVVVEAVRRRARWS